jgi:hypothetical protein
MDARAQAPRWHWAPATNESPQRAGSSLHAAVVKDRLHVLTPRADGSAVTHARLDGDRLLPLPDAPLRSLSGVAALGDSVLVAGARPGDDAPVVLVLDPGGELKTAHVLPCPAPVAGWPLLAAPHVVWATGDLLDATVWLADVTSKGPVRPIRLVSGVGVLGFQAGIGADGAVDVLCYGQNLHFARWRQGSLVVERVLDAAGNSATALLAGSVLTPSAAHAFRAWDPETDRAHTLELPAPPERAAARARHARLVSAPGQPDVLAWQTHLPDDTSVRVEHEGSSRRVHGVSVRGWLAPFDRVEWKVGPSEELPSSSAPPVLGWVGERLALVGVAAGVVQVLLGREAST